MTSEVDRNSRRGADAAQLAAGLVGDADPVLLGRQGVEPALGLGQREEHRARELAVEHEEGGGPVVAEQAALAAHERLLRTAARQHDRPRRLPARQPAGGDQPGGHVGALEAAAEHEEVPGLVVRHRRVGDAAHQGGPLAHPRTGAARWRCRGRSRASGARWC